MSDYERLVELAAKGMAARDNYPLPKSVTTPEAFYEVMACAALDAIGLQAILEDLARAEREPKEVDEGHDLVDDAEVATPNSEEQAVPPQNVPSVPPPTRVSAEYGARDTSSRRERGRGKAENARLRCK